MTQAATTAATAGQASAVSVEEPALRTYFFGPGYSDLRAFQTVAWQSATATAQDYQGRATGALPSTYSHTDVDTYTKVLTSAFWYSATLCCYLANFVTLAIIVSLHALILGVGTAFLFCAAACIRLFDRAWRLIWRIRYSCPQCYHINKLPVYLCPSCGQKHRQLIPGLHGVFRRFCKCGANLPTIHVMGRRSLPCECSACATPLLNVQTSDMHVAFVGGPSSGKTNLFFMQLYEMAMSYPEAGYDKFQYAEEAQKRFCDEQIAKLLRGEPAAKTVQSTPRATHLLLHPEKWPVDHSLMIYDVAGEAFLTEDAVSEHAFYDHLDSIIFVVDPFSIPEVADYYKQPMQTVESAVSACSLVPEEAYTRMLTTLKSYCRRGAAGIRNARLAVVISKVDMFDLKEQLGRGEQSPGTGRETSGNKPEALSQEERIDRACREWLERHGQGHLLRLMQNDFGQVRFFAASALGRPPQQQNSERFRGLGVLDPLAWSVPRLRWRVQNNGR